MRRFWLKLTRRYRMQRDLEAELEFHRDMAQRAGNPLPLGKIREESYDAWRFALVEDLWRDFVYASRSLRKNRSLLIAAVLSLALGIGANTAMFAVIDAQLRPLPFPQPERLLAVLEKSPQFPRMSLSYPDLLDLQANNHSFSELAGVRGSNMILTRLGPPVMVLGQRVSANFFRMLGIHPLLGRGFLDSEDQPGAPDVVVLSDRFWRERLDADRQCLGRTLNLDGRERVIIGVMPPEFPGFEPEGRQTQFWTPLGAYAGEDSHFRLRGTHSGILALGRLRPDKDLDTARKDLDSVARALALEYPATNSQIETAAQSYLDMVVGDTRPALWFLMGAVGLVLLIACANVAGLLLARAATQRRQLALRTALGASRVRLIRGYLLEALILATLGSMVGVSLCAVCLSAIPAILPTPLPRRLPVGLNSSILGFAIIITVLTSLLCGVIPALEAGRLPIARVLQEGATSIAHGRRRIRNIVVVFEMAVALVLLIGAGVMISSLIRLQQIDSGLTPKNLLTFITGLPDTRYPQTWQQFKFFRDALDALDQVPGIEAAAGVFPLPFSGNDWQAGFTLIGRPEPEPGRQPTARLATVRGPYFQVVGIRRLRGRDFDERDTVGTPAVAIVDSRFAKGYWPEAENAVLGQQLKINGEIRTIVGVVSSVTGFDPADSEGQVYIPQEQSALNTNVLYFVQKTGVADPLALRTAAVNALYRVDPLQPVTDIHSMNELLDSALAARRHALDLMSLFAVLALAMAATGVYGIVGYTVSERTAEIGVRIALGAGRSEVIFIVLRQGLRLAFFAVAGGMAAALALIRFSAAFLPGMQWKDPVVLLAAPAVIIVVASLACYLPARRATRVDPLLALRS
jgi:putative ABC transport system permease protein